MIRKLRELFIFCFVVFSLSNLTACSKKSYFDIYVERLESLLEETIPNPKNLSPSVLPRQIVLNQKSAELSIDLLDFLALSRCELQLVIAERNSGLGKVAVGSQQLIHELSFLNLAEECLERLNPDDKVLKEKIQEAIFEKKRYLPATIARATLGGPEFREMWSRSSGKFFFDSKGILALKYIRNKSENWLEGTYQLEDLELEDNLLILRAVPLAEYVRKTLRITYYLQKLTILIEEEHRRGGFCRNATLTDKGVILRNIVRTYFTKASLNEVNIASRGLGSFLLEIQKLDQLFLSVLSEEYK